jgi:hypothetical protein
MLPNFGKGSIVKYNLDLIMTTLFNSKLRTLADFEVLAYVHFSFVLFIFLQPIGSVARLV